MAIRVLESYDIYSTSISPQAAKDEGRKRYII